MVDEPERERLVGADHAVLAQRVLDDQLHGRLGADEPGQELRPAPRRKEPEEDLGEREVADVRGERAEVAVERELEPAAERGAVDGRERREGERAKPAEERVTRRAALAGALGRDPGELRDVGARREDEGLAGDDEAAPVAALELVERRGERGERLGAERLRLAPVGAVVDRDERDRADARRDRLEVEPGDGVVASHDAGSPRGAPRPSRARCRAP